MKTEYLIIAAVAFFFILLNVFFIKEPPHARSSLGILHTKKRWRTVLKCKSCRKRLSFSQVMDSLGTCPHCGSTNDSTVIDHTKESILE